MQQKHWLIIWLLGALVYIAPVYAQQAVFNGKVTEEDGSPVAAVSIRVQELALGTASDTAGNFRLSIPSGRKFTFIFSHISYQEKRISLSFSAGQAYTAPVILQKETKLLREIEVRSGKVIRLRPEISITKIDPQNIKTLPSAFGDFNKMLNTLPGVISNNELSSTYSVRGGNFDENLVYVNGIEVYRPFLARSGQQEGLSFVNPDLVADVEFSSGGWQAKYGDKLSSVLNIAYKEPQKTAGSLTLGLLGGAAHIEGVSTNKRITYIAGIREKRSQYLLGTLDVKGEYLPRFTDMQGYIHFDLSRKTNITTDQNYIPKTSLDLLLSYARNRYFVKPVSRQTSFGTQEQILRLFVAFNGQELLNYDMYQNGLKFTHRPNSRLTLHVLASAMQTSEREYLETDGYYRLCDVDPGPGSSGFNECIATRGAGGLYTHARNKLKANIFNLESRNKYDINIRNYIEWGARFGHERITDVLDEYAFTDSADYVTINELLLTDIQLRTNRLSGYVQHNFLLSSQHTFTYGVRLSYWSLNKQFLVSPTAQYSFKPDWEKQVIFKAAAGIYRQPPFYRELRNRAGEINPSLKAQSSLHVIAGAERVLKLWNRDFLFTAEAYYKSIWDAVAYDVENVRIRYYANNNTKAYAWGTDLRLSGEFIKGAESWFSLGILNTKEDLGFDRQGYVRRPTDQRVSFSAFFQDHIPRNPTVRVYLNLVFGTGLPFSPPQVLQYRSAFTAPLYRRLDMGFSKIIQIKNRTKGLGKFTESIWLGAEVLNVIGAQNTISYTWITDVQRRQFAVPNTLSARFVNLRVIAKFEGK